MAKTNKKNPHTKKAPTHSTAKRVIGKAVKIVISCVVICGILYGGLSFFGVPERIIKAVEVDGKSYSMAELSVYYMLEYNNYRYQASYYDQNYGDGYGSMLTGYDYNLSPAEQTTKDDDGNEITWDEQFMHLAVVQMAQTKRYYKAAVEAGTELTDEDNETIEKAMTQFDSALGNYSLSRYLTKSMGKGVNERLYKKVVTEQQLVSRYQENIQDGLKADLTEDQINEVYEAAKPDYDSVDFRWFTIDVAKADEEAGTEASDGTAEMAAAEAFIASIENSDGAFEDDFKAAALAYVMENDADETETYKLDGATLLQKVAKSSIQSNISSEAADWIFEQDDSGKYARAAGDMKAFLKSDNSVVYIIGALDAPYRDETVKASVRHILIQPETADDTSVEEDVVTDSSEVLESVTGDTAELTTSADTAAAEDTTAESAPAFDAEAADAAAKEKAESLLAEYEEYIKTENDGKPDEDYFADLADKNSADTATTSNGNGSGGLIEDLANDGSYVPEFEDWVFAEGDYAGETRTEGDVAIVKTEYGYHVMYFVGGHEFPTWYETIQDNLIQDDWTEWQDNFEDQYSLADVYRYLPYADKVRKNDLKIIETYLSS